MHKVVISNLPTKDDINSIRGLQQKIAEKVLELHKEVEFEEIHDSFIFNTKEDFEKFQQLSREIKLDVDIMNLHSYTLKNVIAIKGVTK